MKSLVYLAPVPWSAVAQRPHKFVEWFHAAHGGRVLWVDPSPSRLPQLRDLQRFVRPVVEPAAAVPPWMELSRVRALPIEPLPGAAQLNASRWAFTLSAVRRFTEQGACDLVVGKPSKLALAVLARGAFARTVYDAMDDFPSFHPGWAGRVMAEVEAAVAGSVQVVYASATLLQRKFTAAGRPVPLVRNACDPASLPVLNQVAALREPGLVGYIGTLARWFDWGLLESLARAHPHRRFRLIGPLHTTVPRSLPGNVEVRGPCAHREAMQEMARFSIGLIPFHLDSLTAAVDPVKYYEYRALGIPVLSTPFGEMPQHATQDDGVVLVRGDTSLREALEAAERVMDGAAKVQAFRDANAWERRFADAEAAC